MEALVRKNTGVLGGAGHYSLCLITTVFSLF